MKTKNYPNYSVLMSVYYKDNSEWLNMSIECMLNQTVKPSEFVLVEDGSLTDDLDSVINKYEKKFPRLFKIIKNKNNKGLGLSLQEGITHCSNEWIARMDSDDYSPCDRIEKQFNILEEYPDLGIIGSNAIEFIDSIDNKVASVVLPENNEEIIKYSKRRCPYRHSGIIYRKSEVLAAGNYKDCYCCEDYDLYSRMEMNGTKGYNIQEFLLYVRVNPDFYERRGGLKYLKSILSFKTKLYKNGFFSFKDYIISAGAHVVVCLLPNKVRTFVYKRLLRKE